MLKPPGNNLGLAGGHNLSKSAVVGNGSSFVWLVNNDGTVRADALGKMILMMDEGFACSAGRYLALLSTIHSTSTSCERGKT